MYMHIIDQSVTLKQNYYLTTKLDPYINLLELHEHLTPSKKQHVLHTEHCLSSSETNSNISFTSNSSPYRQHKS